MGGNMDGRQDRGAGVLLGAPGARRAVRRARAGFSLVELSIAIVVLMVAVLTAFEVQLGSQRLVRTSRETNTAMADLGAAMEQALLLPKDDIPVAGSMYAADQTIDAFTGLHLRDERMVATYPGYLAGGPVPDPLVIVLTVTWADHAGRPRALQLSSMKTR